MNTLLVTGGAGFIGSNFVRLALQKTSDRIIIVDKLTYAGNRATLANVMKDPRVAFHQADIADRKKISTLLAATRPHAIINFAAETHVDRAIDGPRAFVDTNVTGTYELLQAARQYHGRMKNPTRFRFIQISTDEVFGSLGSSGVFRESSPYAPNSPYSASKAGGDHLARSFFTTYGLPTIVTNGSNNFGPYQFPEKLIPLMILNALEGKPLPIYGDGKNVRDWIFVEDHCTAVLAILRRARPGERYNIGGGNETTNRRIVDTICAMLDEIYPAWHNTRLRGKRIRHYAELQTFVKDRPGHDRRYAIDSSKIRRELGWKPAWPFDTALVRTIQWYLFNLDWCRSVQTGKYNRERLGLIKKGKGA